MKLLIDNFRRGDVNCPPPAPACKFNVCESATAAAAAGRSLLRIAVLCGFLAATVQVTASDDVKSLDPKVASYLKTYCLDCHGGAATESDFRIDTLSAKVGFENTPQWLEVIERINSGEMPPMEAKRIPKAEESAASVEWLSSRIKEGEAARMAARGRVSYNRLTRDEYVNTMRDLIGVHRSAWGVDAVFFP